VTAVLLTAAVLLNGIGAGIMLATVVGIVPFLLTMPYQRYVETVKFLWPRYDPMMPILNVATVVLDVALTFTATGRTRTLVPVAGALLLSVIVISVTRNVPINRYVTALDPARSPADWPTRDPRVRWRNWNLLRTLLATAALTVNAAAAVQR
jgi:uncharacterized membrane protein